jgi:SH3 domain-containing YSC84-like protein 1
MKRTIRFSVLFFTLAALICLPIQAFASENTDAPRTYHTINGATAYNNYMKSQSAIPNEVNQLSPDLIDSPRIFHTKNATANYDKYMASQASTPDKMQTSMAVRSDSEKTVSAATRIFKDAAMSPSRSIPAPVIEYASGIAIFPGKTDIGTQRNGVMLARQKDGRWSSPVFVSLTGPGTHKSTMNAKPADVVLVFKDRGVLNKVARGDNFTLGVDANVAKGYVGMTSSTTSPGAQILAYQRSEGRFTGTSLNGSVLNIEEGPTLAYYNLTDGTAGAHGYYRSSSEGLYHKIIGSTDSSERIERHPISAVLLQQVLRNYVTLTKGQM